MGSCHHSLVGSCSTFLFLCVYASQSEQICLVVPWCLRFYNIVCFWPLIQSLFSSKCIPMGELFIKSQLLCWLPWLAVRNYLSISPYLLPISDDKLVRDWNILMSMKHISKEYLWSPFYIALQTGSRCVHHLSSDLMGSQYHYHSWINTVLWLRHRLRLLPYWRYPIQYNQCTCRTYTSWPTLHSLDLSYPDFIFYKIYNWSHCRGGGALCSWWFRQGGWYAALFAIPPCCPFASGWRLDSR